MGNACRCLTTAPRTADDDYKANYPEPADYYDYYDGKPPKSGGRAKIAKGLSSSSSSILFPIPTDNCCCDKGWNRYLA